MSGRGRRSAAASVLVAAVMSCGCGPTSAATPATAVADTVPYADGVTLDLHVPDGLEDAPTIVLLHGCCGDPADVHDLAVALAARGVLVANAGWTPLERGGGWPRSYGEVACAVGTAGAHADALGAEGDEVTVVAWSDGALLAAVAALAPPVAAPGCEVPGRRPAAVVALGGYLGGGPDGPRAVAGGSEEGPAAWFGGTRAEVPEAWRDGNPHALLAEGRAGEPRVPFDLVVGRDDPLAADARRFARAVRAEGWSATVHEVAGGHLDVISPRTPGGASALEVILARTGGGS